MCASSQNHQATQPAQAQPAQVDHGRHAAHGGQQSVSGDSGMRLRCAAREPRLQIVRATWRPICFAAGAMPGTGPAAPATLARSPATKISGCAGTLRSGATCTRPARSSGAPSWRPSGEAATPAAHNTVRAAMNSSPIAHALCHPPP